MKFHTKLMSMLFITSLFFSSATFASDPIKSGTIVIDETQVSAIIGGDMGVVS